MNSSGNTGPPDPAERKRVVLRSRAARDIAAIRTYLEGQRVSAAARFGERLEETWDILSRLPLLGRPARSQRLLRKGYRTFVMDEYFLYYKVQAMEVEIYRVKHAAPEFREGSA